MSLIRVRFLKDAPPYAAGELAGFPEEKVVQLERSQAAVRDVDQAPAGDDPAPGEDGVGAGGADTAQGGDDVTTQAADAPADTPPAGDDTAPARGSARGRRG